MSAYKMDYSENKAPAKKLIMIENDSNFVNNKIYLHDKTDKNNIRVGEVHCETNIFPLTPEEYQRAQPVQISIPFDYKG
jgi:hypothetical protein